jgi:hypothetical protein
MPLVVEDGTGVTGANAYADVAAVDTYFLNLANAVWAALATPAKEAAIIAATQYMDLVWSKVAPGRKYKDTQGLAWPRLLCCEDTEPAVFPAALVTACAEYAVRASAGPLAPDPEYDASGRQPTMSKDKVGPLEEERRWLGIKQPIAPTLFKPYPIPDAMMRSFLPSTGKSGRLVR